MLATASATSVAQQTLSEVAARVRSCKAAVTGTVAGRSATVAAATVLPEVLRAVDLVALRTATLAAPRRLQFALPSAQQVLRQGPAARSLQPYMRQQGPLLLPRRPMSSFQRSGNSNNMLELLETDASRMPNNGPKQAELYTEWNRSNNFWQTIRRFETGQFAANEAATKEYIVALRAVDRLDRVVPSILRMQQDAAVMSPSSMFAQGAAATTSAAEASSAMAAASPSLSSSAPMGSMGSAARPFNLLAGSAFTVPGAAMFGGGSQVNAFSAGTAATAATAAMAPSLAAASARAPSGTPVEPVHVIMQDPSYKQQLFKLARSVVIVLAVAAAIMTVLDERVFSKSVTPPSSTEPTNAASHYRFTDVEGVDEAKQELMEVVEYLRDPEKFTRLGGRLPKGVLLTGPPGTGKTLLAKTVAGEANVPFFYCSGSEFDEMFVGVGARRVRDLFASARKSAPCIIFIDEIDAVGSSRNPKDFQMVKMTLNQLLVEMDGFSSTDSVIVMGATNFPELLDKALVRPGRFDRHINVPLPDIHGRECILKLHAAKVPMASDVRLDILARGTPGFSGADLANMVNEAAVRASMEGATSVAMEHFEYAKDKIIMGAERKSAVVDENNRRIVAFHEGGHALVALKTTGALPVHKATIMPRGDALGMVAQLPEKDELSWTRQQLMARMDVALGGRAAEELIFGNDAVTSGASSDLSAATRVAWAMVTKYGMSSKVGPILYNDSDLERLSPSTRESIDQEVKRLLEESRQRAAGIISKHKEDLHRLATALLEYETLTREEIEQVLAGQPLARERTPKTNTPTPTNIVTNLPAPGSGSPTPVPVPVPVHA